MSDKITAPSTWSDTHGNLFVLLGLDPDFHAEDFAKAEPAAAVLYNVLTGAVRRIPYLKFKEHVTVNTLKLVISHKQ